MQDAACNKAVATLQTGLFGLMQVGRKFSISEIYWIASAMRESIATIPHIKGTSGKCDLRFAEFSDVCPNRRSRGPRTDWINLIKLFIKRLIRKMTNWPTSWKVIFGDHTTQQIILRVAFGDRTRLPRKKHGKSIFGNFWDRRMGALFIHISESINLNMRLGTVLEKSLAIHLESVKSIRKVARVASRQWQLMTSPNPTTPSSSHQTRPVRITHNHRGGGGWSRRSPI